MSVPSSLFLSSSFPLCTTSSPSLLPVCRSVPVLPSSLAPTDSSDSDLELSTVRHQPEGLDQLQAQTKFTRKELQSLYRGFKNVRQAVARTFSVAFIAMLLIATLIVFNIFPPSSAGVSQWDGWWGDVQDHLFSVLSPRRLDSKTIAPFLSFLGL